MFSKYLVIEMLKYLDINRYIINLNKDKELLYKLIYSFKLIKLKTFKIYININIINSFICLSKLFTKASILFNYK